MRRRLVGQTLLITGLVSVLVTLWLALTWVPSVDRVAFSSPDAQRIFYWHVPTAWVSFLAFTILFSGSLMWFLKRSELGWRMHEATAEIALMYAVFVVVAGPIWGAAEWGTPWDWSDARLNTYGLLTLVGFFLVLGRRSQPDTEATRDTFSSVALFGFVLVPITYLATWLWQLRHPRILGGEDAGGIDDARMAWTLIIGTVSWTILFAGQVLLRWEMVGIEWRLERVQRALDERRLVTAAGPGSGSAANAAGGSTDGATGGTQTT